MESSTALAPATGAEIYTRSIATFQDGAQILSSNTETVSKAVTAGQRILNMIQDAGGKLTPELDKLCNDYLAKINLRKRELEEGRKPITQMMDAVKGLFTAEEAKLDIKRAGTIPFIVQDLRNGYAKEQAEEQRRRDQERQQQAAKEKEAVDLRAECERRQSQYFRDYLSAEKSRLQQAFNAITLETFDGKRASLLGYTPAYPYEHFKSFQHGLVSRLHSPEELTNIVTNIVVGRYDEFSGTYNTELAELKQQLVDRLPSKKNELEQMAKADADEKRRLEDDRKKREQDESDRLQQEEESRRQEAEDAIKSRQTEGAAMSMFASLGDLEAAAPAPETRKGYDITVTHPAGWALIFQFWFQKEGARLAMDKFASKKLESMKTFCENYAHKHGEKIESQHLVYEPSYKAVNRKSEA